MSLLFFILLQYDVYLMYFWCIHVINFSYICENFILSVVFILSRHVIYCWKLLENCIIMYYIYEFNIFYIVAIWCIPDVFLMYFWCIHVINFSYIGENFILSAVFILSRHVIPYVFLMFFLMYFWCIHIITTRRSIQELRILYNFVYHT